MSADRILKICLLLFVLISAAVLLDVLPADDDALKIAEEHVMMDRNCAKPDHAMFGLKSLLFCSTNKNDEN